MGSFAGHIDGGIVFIILGLWWIYNASKNYFKCKEKGQPYSSRISYASTIRGRRLPLEIMLKTAFPAVGFLAEIWNNSLQFVDEDGEFRWQSSMQHMTLYFLFTMHGVSDIIDYLELSSMHEMKYITGGLAFAWYGGGFYFHSDASTGKTPLERIVHRLPVSMLFITSLMYFIEACKRDSILTQVIRCHTVLTFGTWFSYISFILFSPTPFPGSDDNPNWDQHNMKNVHFMVTAFGMHLIINMLIIMAAFYISESYRKCTKCLPLCKEHVRTAGYEKVKLIDTDDPVFGENEL